MNFPEFLSRQASLKGIGEPGIQKLQTASVTVVGVGGVGSAAAEYLARFGVGYLKLIDQDIILPTNLTRQHSTERKSLYHPKSEALSHNLSERYPWCRTNAVVDTLRESNAGELLTESDVIVDGLDNFRTRRILNQHSVRTRTPYVFTAALGNQGHVAVLNPPNTACFDCSIGRDADRVEENCEAVGISPSVIGLVGAIAASETIRMLLPRQSRLLGSLLTVDLDGPDFVSVKLAKSPDCSSCGESPVAQGPDHRVAVLCGGRAATVIPDSPQNIPLRILAGKMPSSRMIAVSNSALVYRYGTRVVSLFMDGRLLLEGINSEEEALEVSETIRDEVGSLMTVPKRTRKQVP